MQGWHCGKGLIYLTASISANKISPPQSQFYTDHEGKYYLPPGIFLDFERREFSLISRKKWKYLLLAIYWFGISKQLFSSVSVNNGRYLTRRFAVRQISTTIHLNLGE